MAKKIKLIVDSDTANEIDDVFALAYVGASRDKFNLVAITIAPFSVNYKRINILDGIVESKLEANRILRLTGYRDSNLVFKGATDFFSDSSVTNDAVDKIVAEAKKGEITIVGLGVLTNIAIALKLHPEIAPNIHLIWMGTKHLFYDKFDDTNYKRDKKAFEFVFKSNIKITVIPSFIGKFIQTSESYMKKAVAVNDLGRYLYKAMKASPFSKTSMGVRTIYDLAPIAYLINPAWFHETTIQVNKLLKEFSKTDSKKTVTYIFDMEPNGVVWNDFVERVSSQKNIITRPKIFFISDTHFGDGRRYKLEQTVFRSVDELNSEVIKRWNSVVTDKDIVYHLGDFGDYKVVKKLNGKITLICGNYEKEDMKGDFYAFKKKLIKLGFADVKKNGIWLDENVCGCPVYMTHKPNNCKKDAINLFGHVHILKPVMQNGINVAMVYHDYTPVDEAYIKNGVQFLLSALPDSNVFRDIS